MLTTTPTGRSLARALAAWIDAVNGRDNALAAQRREEAGRQARALAGDPVLGPALLRHLPPGGPAGGEDAMACAVAILRADAAARAAAPHN